MERPLAYFGGSFLLMLILSNTILPMQLTVAMGIICLAFALFSYFKKKFKLTIILTAATVAVLYLNLFCVLQISPLDKYLGETVSAVAIVNEVDENSGYNRAATVKTSSINGEKLAASINVYAIAPVEIGDEISLNIEILKTKNISSYSKGVYLEGKYIDEIDILAKCDNIYFKIKKLRSSLSQVIFDNMKQSSAAVVAAITFGDKSRLSYETKQIYSRAGVSHILVVSGLHISLIAATIFFILGRFLKNRFILNVSVILSIAFYAVLVGLTPSVIRASFAVILVCISKIVFRKSDIYTTLGLAALIILLSNPYSSIDVSLLYSFCATFGIVAFSEIYDKNISRYTDNKIIKKVLKYSLVPLAALFATFPVSAAIGGGFSLFSVYTNAVIVPLVTPLLITAIIAVFTSGYITPLSGMFFYFDEIIVTFFSKITQGISNIPFGFIYFSGYFVFVSILLIYIYIYFMYKLRFNSKIVPITILLIFISIAINNVFDANTIKFAVVGANQNPTIVVTKGTKAAVIYRGTKGNNSYVQRYLEQNNIRSIETIIDISKLNKDSYSTLSLDANETIVFTKTDDFSNKIELFDDVDVIIKKQSIGNICIVQTKDTRLVLTSGAGDFEGYDDIDYAVSGSARLQNITANTIIGNIENIEWLQAARYENLIFSDKNEIIWIRPNISRTLYFQ